MMKPTSTYTGIKRSRSCENERTSKRRHVVDSSGQAEIMEMKLEIITSVPNRPEVPPSSEVPSTTAPTDEAPSDDGPSNLAGSLDNLKWGKSVVNLITQYLDPHERNMCSDVVEELYDVIKFTEDDRANDDADDDAFRRIKSMRVIICKMEVDFNTIEYACDVEVKKMKNVKSDTGMSIIVQVIETQYTLYAIEEREEQMRKLIGYIEEMKMSMMMMNEPVVASTRSYFSFTYEALDHLYDRMQKKLAEVHILAVKMEEWMSSRFPEG